MWQMHQYFQLFNDLSLYLPQHAMYFLYWKAQHWTQHSREGLTTAEWKERITSLDLFVTHLLMQFEILLDFFTGRTHC